MRRKFWVIVLKKDCQLIQNTITCYQFTIFVARVYVDMYQRHPWQCQVILGVFWGFKSRFQFRMIKNSALFLAPPTFFPNKNMARKIPGTATTFAHACVMTPCYRHVMRATPRSAFPVVTGMMDTGPQNGPKHRPRVWFASLYILPRWNMGFIMFHSIIYFFALPQNLMSSNRIQDLLTSNTCPANSKNSMFQVASIITSPDHVLCWKSFSVDNPLINLIRPLLSGGLLRYHVLVQCGIPIGLWINVVDLFGCDTSRAGFICHGECFGNHCFGQLYL